LDTEITNKSVIYPWQCDAMGHLATQFYMAVFDDASYHFLHLIGHVSGIVDEQEIGWADVQHDIRYQRELTSGDLVVVKSKPMRISARSVTYENQLINSQSGVICATMTATTVQFDLNLRRAIEIIPVVRTNLTSWLESGSPSNSRHSATGLD